MVKILGDISVYIFEFYFSFPKKKYALRFDTKCLAFLTEFDLEIYADFFL